VKGWKAYETAHLLFTVLIFPSGSIRRAIGPLFEDTWCPGREKLQVNLLGDLSHFVFHLSGINQQAAEFYQGWRIGFRTASHASFSDDASLNIV